MKMASHGGGVRSGAGPTAELGLEHQWRPILCLFLALCRYFPRKPGRDNLT